MQENRFAEIIELSRDLLCVHDAEGKYLFVSKSVFSHTGYQPSELLGRSAYDFFHPDDIDRIRDESHRPVLENQKRVTSEYRFRKKDGSYVWFQTFTEIASGDKTDETLLYTYTRDISEEVRVRSELAETKSLLLKANKMAGLNAWEVDLEEETIKWVGAPVFGKATNPDGIYPLETAAKLYTPDSQKVFWSFFEESRNGLKNFEMELNREIDGNIYYIRSIGNTIFSKGKPKSVKGFSQDITSIREKEKALSEALKELRIRENRLTEFHRIISHNLRAPVANLSGLLMIVEQSSESEKEEYLKLMKDTVSGLDTMLEGLVNSIKIDTGTQTGPGSSVSHSLTQTMQLLQHEIRNKEAEVTTDFFGFDEVMYPQPVIDSILLNLLSNSLKYASPKRKLKINVSTVIEAGRKVLIFTDNGIGIPKENISKVFDLKFKTENRDDSKGFGLFMTYNQVRSLGGLIKVSSTFDEETTFKITF